MCKSPKKEVFQPVKGNQAIGAGTPTVLTTTRSYHTGIQFTDGPNFVMFYRPLDSIPAGSKISARTRSSVVVGSLDVLVALVYLEKPL